MEKISKILIIAALMIVSQVNYGAKKINLKKSATKSQRELILEDEGSFVFDEDYIHDQDYINSKIDEIEASAQSMSGVYNNLDNIILKNKLFDSYNNWVGTRYKWGGVSKSGIDCSALTREVYKEVFGYNLPRVSIDQVKKGRRINMSELKPGDLLYFRPKNRINHIAVYIGNSLFINASSSKGVVLSSMDNSYWKKYFKYAVRVDDARVSE